MKQTDYSETLAYNVQKARNYPEESIQHSEHGESLKSRMFTIAIKSTTSAVKANIFNFVFIYESSKAVRISSRATCALSHL